VRYRLACYTGCGNGSTCDRLSFYLYVKEISCSVWLENEKRWTTDNCKVRQATAQVHKILHTHTLGVCTVCSTDPFSRVTGCKPHIASLQLAPRGHIMHSLPSVKTSNFIKSFVNKSKCVTVAVCAGY